MTDQTSCPLCMEPYQDKDIKKISFVCGNFGCIVRGVKFSSHTLTKIESQIAHIRQEAKQEVFDDLDKKKPMLCGNCSKCVENDAEECLVYHLIKKKHGVE